MLFHKGSDRNSKQVFPQTLIYMGKADWTKVTGVYLSPYCRLPSFACKCTKRDDTKYPGKKTQSGTMEPVQTTLFLDLGNEQAPSQCNNQPTEAPILDVGCNIKQGHGKSLAPTQ